MHSPLGLLVGTVEKFFQVVDVLVNDEDDVRTIAAVAAVWATFGGKLFPTEAGATVTAIAGFGVYSDMIDKHGKLSSLANRVTDSTIRSRRETELIAE
jgi:hypothetical protein